jgi:hypothetical protein
MARRAGSWCHWPLGRPAGHPAVDRGLQRLGAWSAQQAGEQSAPTLLGPDQGGRDTGRLGAGGRPGWPGSHRLGGPGELGRPLHHLEGRPAGPRARTSNWTWSQAHRSTQEGCADVGVPTRPAPDGGHHRPDPLGSAVTFDLTGGANTGPCSSASTALTSCGLDPASVGGISVGRPHTGQDGRGARWPRPPAGTRAGRWRPGTPAGWYSGRG